MAAMDDRSRIADQSILRTLGWGPGTPVRIAVDDGNVVVTAEPDSLDRLTASGHLRLPGGIRHQLGLRPGDRMLLAASPDAARLHLYPPAVLDKLLASSATVPPGGSA